MHSASEGEVSGETIALLFNHGWHIRVKYAILITIQARMFTIHTPLLEGPVATFRYSYKNDAETFTFAESHTFPFELKDSKALRALAIASAVSYFKLHLSPHIHIGWSLSQDETSFWQWVFRNGFSELVYQNKLDWEIVDRIQIHSSTEVGPMYTGVGPLEKRAIVGIGGGKDSSLAVEMLKKLHVNVEGFATKVRSIPLLKENAQALGIPLTEVVRKTDPQLLTLKENVYLGHIPISLVYACTGLVIAEHTRSMYVVVANETSADESNTEWQGRAVNHQWSKTSEFEKKFQDFVHQTISHGITYFSILRPYGGYKVTDLFSRTCAHVFNAFSSCNKNFTIEDHNKNRWCGACAKCLGTYMLLTPLLSKEVRLQIFGQDLLQNKELLPLAKELLGISPVKPFDCVATKGEMCFAIQGNIEFKESVLGGSISLDEWSTVSKIGQEGEKFTHTHHPHFIPEDLNIQSLELL